MAHLLGSESCLESLGRDVSDVQAVIVDVISRVGPVRFPSWKYPDKVSSELDVEELLERYCFSEDEDHCKLSHIILFELLIDRLVLLLQSMSQFVEQTLKASGHESRPQSGILVGSAMSVGLVAKKYWNKAVKLQQSMQQIQLEEKTKNKTLYKMEGTITELRDEIKMCKEVIKKKSGRNSSLSGKTKGHGSRGSSAKFILSPTESLNLRSPSPSQDLMLTVEDVAFAKTFQEIATQTYDTAFIPCEACSRTQQNLLEVGNEVMKLCESQGLPSSLAKQKKLLRKSLMAAADISRWASEQNQDIARINSHLDNLYAQINPLEAKLKSSEERCQKLQKDIEGLASNFDEERTQLKEQEEEARGKLNNIIQEKDSLLSEAADVNKQLEERKAILQDMVAKLNITIQNQEETLKKLENENSGLLSNLERETKEVERLKGVDEEIVNIQIDLNDVQIKLRETSLELGKTQAKNRSLVKHEQALQGKHDALLQRVDELDEECEDLRQRLTDVEGERDDLQDALSSAQDDNSKLNEQLQAKLKLVEEIKEEKSKLMSEVEDLQNSSVELQQQLEETEEKLKLVTEYPSMDQSRAGINKGSMTNGGTEVTEVDVVKDMERQVMANNIRIQMLEEQNDKLRNSITLLINASATAKRKTTQDPMALWKPHQDERQVRSPGPGCFVDSAPSDSKATRRPPSVSAATQRHLSDIDDYTSFMVQPRPPTKPRAESAKVRQKSPNTKLIEKRHSASLSAKLAGSRKHSQSMIPPAGDEELFPRQEVRIPKEGRGRAKSPSGYTPVDVFICSGCDKMYNSQKDLDIHKSFCYGRIMAMS